MIDQQLLIQAGAVIRKYKKGEFIVKEDEKAKFYFQVVSGEVKMINTDDKGHEFIQGIFNAEKVLQSLLYFLILFIPHQL